MIFEGPHEATRRRRAANLLLSLDGAVGLEKEDVDGAATAAAVVIATCTHSDVGDACSTRTTRTDERCTEQPWDLGTAWL